MPPLSKQGHSIEKDETDSSLPSFSSQWSSWEEHLLPYLVALMDAGLLADLILALNNFAFPFPTAFIMPLWVPFLLLTGVCWLVRRLLFWTGKSRFYFDTTGDGSLELIIVILLHIVAIAGALCLVWFFGAGFWQVFCSTVLFIIGCWRGFRIAQDELDKRFINNVTVMSGIILVLTIFTTNSANGLHNTPLLFLLLLLFFFLALIIRILSTAITLHCYVGISSRLQRPQLSAFPLWLAAIGTGILLFVVTLTISSVINPSFLSIIQSAFSPLLTPLAHVGSLLVAWLFVPLNWLLAAGKPFFSKSGNGTVHIPRYLEKSLDQRLHGNTPLSPFPSPTSLFHLGNASINIGKIILLGAMLIAFSLLIALLLRLWHQYRRRRPKAVLHESIWSWGLFWTQLKEFWRSLLSSIAPLRPYHHRLSNESAAARTDRALLATVEDIREMYQVILNWTAGHGCPRMGDETPYEFEQRLSMQFPKAGLHLMTITDAYVAWRYGGYAPDESEIPHLQAEWNALLTLWQSYSGH